MPSWGILEGLLAFQWKRPVRGRNRSGKAPHRPLRPVLWGHSIAAKKSIPSGRAITVGKLGPFPGRPPHRLPLSWWLWTLKSLYEVDRGKRLDWTQTRLLDKMVVLLLTANVWEFPKLGGVENFREKMFWSQFPTRLGVWRKLNWQNDF